MVQYGIYVPYGEQNCAWYVEKLLYWENMLNNCKISNIIEYYYSKVVKSKQKSTKLTNVLFYLFLGQCNGAIEQRFGQLIW